MLAKADINGRFHAIAKDQSGIEGFVQSVGLLLKLPDNVSLEGKFWLFQDVKYWSSYFKFS